MVDLMSVSSVHLMTGLPKGEEMTILDVGPDYPVVSPRSTTQAYGEITAVQSVWSKDLERLGAIADAARLGQPDPAVVATLSLILKRLHNAVSAHAVVSLVARLKETVTNLVAIIDRIAGAEAARSVREPLDFSLSDLPEDIVLEVYAAATERVDEAGRHLAAARAQLKAAEQIQISPLPLKQKYADSAGLLDTAESHALLGLEAALAARTCLMTARANLAGAANPFEVLVTDERATAPIAVSEASGLASSEASRVDPISEGDIAPALSGEISAQTEDLGKEQSALKSLPQTSEKAGPETPVCEDKFFLAEKRLVEMREQFKVKQTAKSPLAFMMRLRTWLI